MGIRFTEISTPFGGLAWEYTDKTDNPSLPAHLALEPGQKIKVFISSICGDKGKYDRIRDELKKAIEATNLATVYLFEQEGAASIPAGSHYRFALEDCDICIFLIDNADGVTPGVQIEIDTVKRNGIKSLCYFCNETSQEKTPFEKSVTGAQYAKSYTVSLFSDLVKNGAQDLINDIIGTYHHYCKGRLVLNSIEETDKFQLVNVSSSDKLSLSTIPKALLKNIDKCTNYILEFIEGRSVVRYPDEEEKSSDIDEWCLQFLSVMFEGKSIKNFNTAMYLESLKEKQTDDFFRVVQLRWNAIQAYFSGDISKCIEYLDEALKTAKETNQPTWIIKDILIDRRNQHWTNCVINNEYYDSDAQKELTDSDEELYYPLLDRIHESLHEKYINSQYKRKIESPNTVTYGGLRPYGELLASSFVIAMYNGSLTHILLMYERLRDFAFYLCNKYSDWNYKLRLLQLVVFLGKEKEIDGILSSYPEMQNQMTANDAVSVMNFCDNHPIKYRRTELLLRAFGSIGYFLGDEDFAKYEKIIIEEINSWIESDAAVVDVGNYIIKCLSEIAYRMSQDTLADICCKFIDNHYSRWYMDMFKLIQNRLDLRKMKSASAKALIDHIIRILENEEERKTLGFSPMFLCVLRKQNRLMTDTLDIKISEHFPNFYSGNYLLETKEDDEANLPDFVQRYTEAIRNNNGKQGQNGAFFSYATRNHATVRHIFIYNKLNWSPDLLDSVISVASDTLLLSKESISTKLDAASLLVCMLHIFPDACYRNKQIFDTIYEKRSDIVNLRHSGFSSNIDCVALEIGLCLLYAAMGKDVYLDILELMPYTHDSTATINSIASFINEYLEPSDTVVLPKQIEGIILQHVLQWLHHDHVATRCLATRILLSLARNPDNENIVNRQIISLIDTDCAYIKNIIIRRIYELRGILQSTKNYIETKCTNDANFVVRMVLEEQMKKQIQTT